MHDQSEDPPIGKLLKPRLVYATHLDLYHYYADTSYRSKVNQEVATAVSGHLKAGQLALTLGGDHSLVSAHTTCCSVKLNNMIT